MTYEEAIEYAKSVSFCAGCNEPQWSEDAADICGRCKHRQFFELVIDALEKQEKYEWHDLLKNPEDLPKPYDDIVFVVMKSKKHLIGWMNDDDEFDTEDLGMCLDKDVIIAWCYKEFFEGV